MHRKRSEVNKLSMDNVLQGIQHIYIICILKKKTLTHFAAKSINKIQKKTELCIPLLSVMKITTSHKTYQA